jgi:tRNA(Ile)-lysidine synthase
VLSIPSVTCGLKALTVDAKVVAADNRRVMNTMRDKSAVIAGRPGDAGKRPCRFAARLLAEWKRLKLPLKEARFVVAVSGGADSVALLLALDELRVAGRLSVALTVAHLDHGLRASSLEDARWVEELSRSLGYEFRLGRARVRELAESGGDNLEQSARRARYEFLSGLSREDDGVRVILTAHTMDDQAETVLLRLMRGSGAEGLGGMAPVRALDAESNVLLARPLLSWARRAETLEYCRARGAEFRADEMNEDESFARVRVRKQLLPLMQSFNARIVEALVRTAELLREDSRELEGMAAHLLEEALNGSQGAGLSVEVLINAPVALRRRALRLWLSQSRGDLRRLEMVHLAAVERLLEGERGGRVAELPGGGRVLRRRGSLFFHTGGVENVGGRD